MNNQHLRGFRWVGSLNNVQHPPIVRKPVATGYRALSTVSASAVYYDWQEGDPCLITTDGSIIISAGAEDDSPAASVYGIIAGWEPLYDSSLGAMHPQNKYPSAGVVWGTNEQRRSWARVIPVVDQLFEIDVDENTTATTFAAYQDMVGENVDHILSGVAGDMDPRLDISTNAPTNSLLWRIHAVSRTAYNQDFSGTNVKLIVTANLAQQDSTTGV